MKKALVVLLLLAVAGGLFAQVTFSGRINTMWMPFQMVTNDNGDSVMGTGFGRHAGPNVRTRLYMSADHQDTVGLSLHWRLFVNADGSVAPAIGDNAMGWWQPNEYFRLSLGKYAIDTLHSGFYDTVWNYTHTADSEWTWTFDGFRSGRGRNDGGGLGALAALTFGDLGVYLNFRGIEALGNGYGFQAPDFEGNGHLVRTYENIQAAIAYDIGGIGLVRAQYLGATKTADFVGPAAQAAFMLKMVPGLNLDVSFLFPFAVNASDVKSWDSSQYDYVTGSGSGDGKAPNELGLVVEYTLGDIYLGLGTKVFFGGYVNSTGSNQIDDPLKVRINLRPTYDLGFMNLGLDAYVDYFGDNDNLSGGIGIGAGVFLEKKVGGNSVQCGVSYRAATEVYGVKNNSVLSIPVSYNFAF